MSQVDISATEYDPSESTRVLQDSVFDEKMMTLREHQDTDKHYIGDSLPMPAPSTVRSIGAANDVGKSPFPARADHTHEFKSVYGAFSSSGTIMNPGSSYVNAMSHTGWGRNMLASPQVLAFPLPGVYEISINLKINRSDFGTAFQHYIQIMFHYNNGSILRQVHTSDLPTELATTTIVCTDYWHVQTAPQYDQNVQFRISHLDIPWSVYVQVLQVTMISGVVSG
ncbi:MAG: hypothetical protein ABWY25_02710 [Paenisporosarcina sp.]